MKRYLSIHIPACAVGRFRLLVKILFISLLVFSAGNKFAVAQNVSRLSGIVVDQNGGLIVGVEITILNSSGTLERTVLTDYEGFFDFPYLPSDEYSLKISKEGFDPSEIPSLSVSEENARQLKIELKINPISETIKVESERAVTDENKAGLATLDQKLLEDIPLNGRNFQSLINLVPGVIFTPVDNKNLGQFSSNGQRTNANFFTVDGVSANFGTTNYDFLGQTGSGSIPSMNVQGGLDNLISPEALQEVKIQTLDFAPATGKMPGANVSFVSKSGGNDFSLTVFENFRDGAFNAKDYFDTEKLQLQLRVEVYNVFNRPNFSNPQTKILYRSDEKIVTKDFGVPTQTMARGYASAEPTGGVSPIFQLGGSRIIQFNLRIKL